MIRRFYEKIIQHHIDAYSQMIFISGSRQVGKTTIAKTFQTSEYSYLNWDNIIHRKIILGDIFNYIESKLLSTLTKTKPCIILDEIHKFKHWKNLIKGIYDQHKEKLTIIVTGSAKLDVYNKGGDSLMGRYFNYQIFPLSVYELLQRPYQKNLIHPPSELNQKAWQTLIQRGGYPEPYLKNDDEFTTLWQTSRRSQLFREEIRDYANIQNIDQLELLGQLITHQTGSQTNYSNLATKIRVSETTVRSWFTLLDNTYFCFNIYPWTKNIHRSILKAPKTYLYDWSLCADKGAMVENLIALHLLKAISFWNNTGQGEFGLFYLRNKDKREVDFLVTKHNQPWFLAEVKSSAKQPLSDNLRFFQEQLNAPHAFQLALDMDYIDMNLFTLDKIHIVPIKTFLSQLI
ncbi:MAG: ATP-binding protein [Legionella sp.]|jgi:hypothetical protein|nr:ATP-binding protein [Legionella sp.]